MPALPAESRTSIVTTLVAWCRRWPHHPILSHRLTRHVVGGVALLTVITLTLTRSGKLRQVHGESAASALALQTDDDVQRLPRMSGGDWPLIAYIRRNFPPGTPVSIPWVHRAPGRIMKGFWVALLPDYPVRPDAELAIIFIPRLRPQHEVVLSGDRFALVRTRP